MILCLFAICPITPLIVNDAIARDRFRMRRGLPDKELITWYLISIHHIIYRILASVINEKIILDSKNNIIEV